MNQLYSSNSLEYAFPHYLIYIIKSMKMDATTHQVDIQQFHFHCQKSFLHVNHHVMAIPFLLCFLLFLPSFSFLPKTNPKTDSLSVFPSILLLSFPSPFPLGSPPHYYLCFPAPAPLSSFFTLPPQIACSSGPLL